MRNILVLPKDMTNQFGNFAKGTLNFESNNRSIARTWRLINEALKRSHTPFQWIVGDMLYRSEHIEEPYCIDFINDMFLIWAEERGVKCLLAVFESWGTAAKYFVWLTSKGEVEIDWSLYLDMID